MPNALLEAPWKKLLKENPSVTDSGLGDALREYAKAGGKDVDERVYVLKEVISAAEKVKKQSVKSRVKSVTDYLDDVLSEAKETVARLEAEDEDPAGILGDENAYGTYLKKSLKRLETKPTYFAAGLGLNPQDHRIIFHKSRDGQKLLKALRDGTDLKKFAWGLAGSHAEATSTMTLGLESPQLAGLKKKLELLLKYFKPLPFDTILLMVEGVVVPDLAEPDDASEKGGDKAPPMAPDAESLRFAQRLKQIKPGIDKVIAGNVPAGSTVQTLYLAAAQAFKQQDLAAAHQTLDELARPLQQGLEQLRAKSTNGVDPATAFNERLKALLPAIKSVAGTPHGESAKLTASEAATLARKRDFGAANKLLDEVERRLGGSSSGQSSTEGQTSAEPSTADSVWQKALQDWQDARDAVDAQIAKLQVALRESTDEELHEIAEFGLNAITAGHKSRLTAAIRDFEIAAPDKRGAAGRKAAQLAADFSEHLSTDQRVAACDENPLRVSVSIRKTLVPVLAQLNAALGRTGA